MQPQNAPPKGHRPIRNVSGCSGTGNGMLWVFSSAGGRANGSSSGHVDGASPDAARRNNSPWRPLPPEQTQDPEPPVRGPADRYRRRMTTSLPQISPRGGVQQQGAKRHDAGYMTVGYDASQESVSDWTPHDVAEWLYLQASCGRRCSVPRHPALPPRDARSVRRLTTTSLTALRPLALVGDEGRPRAFLPGAQHRWACAAGADAREAHAVEHQARRLQHHPQGRAGAPQDAGGASPQWPHRLAARGGGG